MPVIYKITSPTNKVYIGQSWNFKKREEVYRNGRCSKQWGILNSIKKYGWDSHTIQIVCELPEDVTQDVLNIYEGYYHQQYVDCGIKTMNIRGTGSNGKMADISKRKVSESKKGKKLSEDHKQKISEAGKKRVVSQETKEKLSLIFKGKKLSEKHRLALMTPKINKPKVSHLKGKKLSEIVGEDRVEEVLKRRSEGMKGTHLKPIVCNETGTCYKSVKEAAELTGVNRTCITNILRGLAKKTRSGLSFKYIKDK